MGVTEKPTPVQVEGVTFAIVGFGFTVMVTVNVAPAHVPDFGVTVYVAVCAVLVGLVRVPVIEPALFPVAPPVIPPVTAGSGHEYVVPAGTIPLVPLAGVCVKPVPLHVVVDIAVTAGVGLTVTVRVNVVPIHPLIVGVMR
jgi:hypothetical protein